MNLFVVVVAAVVVVVVVVVVIVNPLLLLLLFGSGKRRSFNLLEWTKLDRSRKLIHCVCFSLSHWKNIVHREVHQEEARITIAEEH